LGLVRLTRLQTLLPLLSNEVSLHMCKFTKAHRKREEKEKQSRQTNCKQTDAIATCVCSQFVGLKKPRCEPEEAWVWT